MVGWLQYFYFYFFFAIGKWELEESNEDENSPITDCMFVSHHNSHVEA